MGSACSTHGENMNAYIVFMAKQEGKNARNNIKMNVRKKVEHEGWIYLAE